MPTKPVDLEAIAKEDSRGLKKRLAFGLVTQALTILTFVGSRFLLVPLYLTAWGVDVFADWLVLQALALLLPSVALGQQWLYGKEIRDAWSLRDIAGMNAWLAASNGFWCLVYAGLGAVMILFMLTVDLTSLLNLDHLERLDAGLVLLLLTATALTGPSQESIRALYNGRGEFARQELIATTTLLVSTSLVASLLLSGASIVTVAVVDCVCIRGLGTLLYVLDSERRFTEVQHRIRLARERFPTLLTVRNFGLPAIAERVSINAPVFILGLVDVSSAQIVQFGLAKRLGQTLRMVARPPAMMMSVELVRRHTQGQGQRKRTRQIHYLALALPALITGTLAGALIASVDLIYAVWTNGTVLADPLIFGLVVGHAAASMLGVFTRVFMNRAGYASDLVLSSLLGSFGYPTLGLVMAIWLGAPGLAGAVLVLDFIFLFVAPAIRLQGRIGIKAVTSIGLPVVTATITGAAAYWGTDMLRTLTGF